jgi:hypothetical protein
MSGRYAATRSALVVADAVGLLGFRGPLDRDMNVLRFTEPTKSQCREDRSQANGPGLSKPRDPRLHGDTASIQRMHAHRHIRAHRGMCGWFVIWE